jgi:hypothetical protein
MHRTSALFSADRGDGIGPHVHAFGMLEDAYSMDTLLHAPQDTFARALHEDYYENQIKEGKAPGSKPALYRWDELSDQFKDSNRQAADHILIKLRAIGKRVDKIRDDRPSLTSFESDDPRVELLAQMEHARWCAELWLQGYSQTANRDDARKLHPCLLPWDKLDCATQEWDRQQVRAIPRALKRGGYRIYSQSL